MELYRKYFTVEQLEQIAQTKPDWGVNVLNVGHNIHPRNKKYPDTNHPNPYCFDWNEGRVLNEYQLVYIASGGGVFEAEKVGSVIVDPGTVFLLYPGVWHRYKPLYDKGWEEYWVGFNGHYAEYLMRQECFDPDTPLIHMGFNTDFLNIFIRLIDTLRFEGVAFSQISSCLTIQLLGLVYASALLKERPHNRKEQMINNLRYKMHENWASGLTMEELAAQHNVSYIWFRKAFKEVVGISPGQYYLNLKLEKACQMLKETVLTVSEIAFLTGFVSEYHFSRIFKKKIGFSPSKYREGGVRLSSE
ncbi:AraC family transcriptional regulator [Pedobacter sp. BS3]|uniref:AraC family transcriptional regulator n=1 Tax=Pedobacter sp. BS3 TaxID=2567937 RepID=UPI0011EDA3BC|nr:AraC family transcriptional regulator [Pedobacter sp. BS3]TZF84127.1 AraC family transcriptional regulator [Pedobacter sp. BS3]